MKFIINILFALLFLQWGYSQTGSFRGHLHDTILNRSLSHATVLITELNRDADTDPEGNFIIKNVPPGTYTLRVSALGYPDRVLDSVKIDSYHPVEMNILYPPECKYKDPIMICPVCKKKDEVIPIVYGLPTQKTMKKAEKEEVMLGGCVVSGCDPQWFCKRDEKWF